VGLSVGFKGFFAQAGALLGTLGEAHAATALIGIASLALLFVFRRVRPLWPSALVAVALAVVAVSVFHLDGGGVSVIGHVPTGMVALSVPELNLEKIMSLLPGALAIVLLGYAVSLGVAKVGAQETKEEIDPDQELVAHGFANVGAALSSGMVVCGSLSRGSVIRGAGGKTQVVSLVNGVLVILTLTFALPLFYRLPLATLAAIVVVAMYGILDIPYMRRLFRFNRAEFAVSMVALFGVLVFGILAGVTIGVVLAIAVLIRRVCRPSTAVLGRLPGTDDFRDVAVRPEAEAVPGLLIFRFDAPVIFVNASYFADTLRRLVTEAEEAGRAVREVLIPAQQINALDSSAAEQLTMILGEFESRGVTLSFAEAKHPLREAIRRSGLEDAIGADRFYESIEEGVQAFVRRQK
jgi:MFS superfamily sulfate permease-like transporter